MILQDLQNAGPGAYKDYKGRLWFAWRPVQTVGGWRWLCLVRRCIDKEGPDAGRPYYREI